MGDRWRFLYCGMTELRGHTREAVPRTENVGKAENGAGVKRPAKAVRGETTELKVGKSEGRVSRKAAIVHTVPVP